jgi:hypothetical protein
MQGDETTVGPGAHRSRGVQRGVSVSVTDDEVQSILAAGRSEVGEEHVVTSAGDIAFTWDYDRTRSGLAKLYEKAKTSQWNGSTDLPWDTDVDQERMAAQMTVTPATARFKELAASYGSEVARWSDANWMEFGIQQQNAMLSNFLHGEQGALICTAKLVEQVPWIDAKYYGATQVIDEARHVEVFARYLDEKMSGEHPINPHLGRLLDAIIADERWDITYLGMQIMVEGLALAAFGFIHSITDEPLLKQLLRYVMSDEARHVAFGVLSLQELYESMSAAELRDRQEFAYEAVLRLRDRWFHTDTWERMGVDPEPIVRVMLAERSDEERMFRTLLFSKIVPNCRKLGLLDAGDGWLRDRFTELGIIEYETWADTSEEYESLDEVERDRTAS